MATRLMSVPGKLPPRFLTTSKRGNNGSTRFARVDFTGAFDVMNEISKAVNEELRSGLEIAAKSGAEYMQDLILRRGTGWGDFQRSEGINHGSGRYKTGQMYNDVVYRTEAGPTKVYASFGWIKDYQDYYGYQETGFRNYGKWHTPLSENSPYTPKKMENWKWTEGMFALFDARQYIKGLSGILAYETKQKILARVRKAKK